MTFLVSVLHHNDSKTGVNFSHTEIAQSYVRKRILTYEKMRAYLFKYDFSSNPFQISPSFFTVHSKSTV